ncbi:hypothetical protein B0H19DRAFT_1069356 [Mycena capillaripes]|nr:hypothetical protein B0H19DRAFT_1069356 [Mycena capillaripes]
MSRTAAVLRDAKLQESGADAEQWAGTFRMGGCNKKLMRDATHAEQPGGVYVVSEGYIIDDEWEKTVHAMRSTSACGQGGGEEEGDRTIIDDTHTKIRLNSPVYM